MAGILERLHQALNAHDAAGMTSLFAEDYRSAQPAHPSRSFQGRAQVHKNWSSLFRGVPDLTAELVASCVEPDRVWGEWEWSGHYADGAPFSMRGVTVFVVRDDLLAEGRLYMEVVDTEADDIDATVEQLSRSTSD